MRSHDNMIKLYVEKLSVEGSPERLKLYVLYQEDVLGIGIL